VAEGFVIPADWGGSMALQTPLDEMGALKTLDAPRR
jgi:hypothetical protein